MITGFSSIRGMHIVLLGLIFYILSFIIGAWSPGIDIGDSGSGKEAITWEGKDDLTAAGSFVKKIFVNNMGLNAIIIIGAFSMLAMSMIILSFNAIQIGYLIKGLYGTYGIKVAILLVVPHLLVEITSHLLSLYVAFLILKNAIVPVLIDGTRISLSLKEVFQTLKLLLLILLTTLLGAIMEVFVTPTLI